MLIDVHCHLTGGEYEGAGGVAAVLERARQNGVTRFICSGFDLESSRLAAELSELYEDVYFCAGFQPEELAKYRDGDFARLEELTRAPKCVAVGEIGLDYHFPDNPDRDFQKEIFAGQLRLADEAGLPVVIHSRDALGDTLEILRSNRAFLKKGGLMHCYSYSAEAAGDFGKLGMYFSFGGTSTFKNAKKVHAAARQIPACRILSETDSPYLTPEPFRGRFPNEPGNVKYVTENLALLRGEDKRELEELIFENAERLFFRMRG